MSKTIYTYYATYNSKGKYNSSAGRPAVIKIPNDGIEGNDYYVMGIDDEDKYDYSDTNRYWFENGIKHRGYGAAVIRDIGDTKLRWYINGEKHNIYREPAYINHMKNGDWEMRWYFKGQLHNINGPAIIKSDGTMEWYENEKLIKSKKNFGISYKSDSKKDKDNYKNQYKGKYKDYYSFMTTIIDEEKYYSRLELPTRTCYESDSEDESSKI